MDTDEGDQGTAESIPTQPGDHIGHYEIIAEIGRGGMGIVYRARDENLGRDVALKRPWPSLAANADCRRRFLREARAASVVSHPNVVQVFEAFEADGCPWIASQHVTGRNLEAVLRGQKRLPVDAVLRYGEDLASALKAAHDRNILHRDVKPQNVLVSSDDRAMLSDFGLACSVRSPEVDPLATTESPRITSEGAVVGTPRYMSPEQVLGRPVDRRSDIFSLGSVLYELCTGAPAFAASERGGLNDAIIHREPEPISRFTHEVPEELGRIIRKMMAKLPEERYQDAGELLVDLRALRRQRDLGLYSETHPLRPPDFARRRALRRLWLLLIPAAITTYLVFLRSREAPLPRAAPVQVTSTDAWERWPVLSPDGGRIAYVSDVRDNTDIYIIDAHGGVPLRITDDAAVDDFPTWFPDGSALAFASDRSGEPSIWKTGQLGGGATLLLANGEQPDLSPDGSRLAFVRRGPTRYSRIWVAPVTNPARATMVTNDGGGTWDHEHPSWSPDGRMICYATRHGLWTVPAAGGAARRLTSEAELDCDPAWSPTGRQVYFTSHRQGTIALWRIAARGGKPERVTLGSSQECLPSVSNDGTRLVYATEIRTRNLIVRDLRSGREVVLRDLSDAHQPAFSPDQRWLVVVSPGVGKELALWLQPFTEGVPSGPPRQLTDQPGDCAHPAFSPDGKFIVYQRIVDENRDLWTIPVRGGQSVRFTEDPAADMNPAWSPDGSAVAFVSERGEGCGLWVASVRDGRPAGPARLIDTEAVQAHAPVWSADGSTIFFVGVDDRGSEVWMVPADGPASARALTSGAGVIRTRWDTAQGDLLVCGTWGGHRFALRRLSPVDGTVTAVEPPVDLGPETAPPTFDVSRDGRTLVYPRTETKGDIWLLEAREGRY